MKENFPHLGKEIDMQVQETQRIPKKLDPRKHTLRHIIITLPTVKHRERCPGCCGSVDWVLACKLRDYHFNSLLGHVPGLWARSPVGGMQEAATH